MLDIVRRLARPVRPATATAFCAVSLLAACQSGDGDARSTVTSVPGDASSVLFAPPAPILSARAIVPGNLSVEVLVGSERLALEQREDGRWSGTLSLAPGQSYTLTLTWSESFEGAPLPLAVATSEFEVSRDGDNEILIPDTAYDPSGLDDDRDGVSNLEERRAETRPRDPTSRPDTSPSTVPLVATFRLPAELAEADEQGLGGFGARAVIGVGPDSRSLPLGREGDTWSGTSTVVQDPSGPVVAVTFFALADTTLALAFAQRAVTSDETSASIVFGPDDYEIRNSDGDALSNLEELIGGSNPRNANDPATDPCLVSAFEPGCTIDTDGDGRFDSQETEGADRDGDGRPDYTESSLIDNDEDGRFADDDTDESDACVPSRDNDACRSELDDDNDGVPNPIDNCRAVPNPDQDDVDGDGVGDECDTMNDRDGDEDGVPDVDDNCPADANTDQADVDGDGAGDECDEVDDRDPDEDGVFQDVDNCPEVSNPDQADVDGDGVGDECDEEDDREPEDTDGDGVPDELDNCPTDPNPDQVNTDGGNNGDACDGDNDNDGVPDESDNCPVVPNRGQVDTDRDGIGDACEMAP